VWRRDDRPPPSQGVVVSNLEDMGRQGILVFLLVEKMEWESLPSILVTRNPNWSHRSGTETDSIKGRY
jgi:hypothetical protein